MSTYILVVGIILAYILIGVFFMGLFSNVIEDLAIAMIVFWPIGLVIFAIIWIFVKAYELGESLHNMFWKE